MLRADARLIERAHGEPKARFPTPIATLAIVDGQLVPDCRDELALRESRAPGQPSPPDAMPGRSQRQSPDRMIRARCITEFSRQLFLRLEYAAGHLAWRFDDGNCAFSFDIGVAVKDVVDSGLMVTRLGQAASFSQFSWNARRASAGGLNPCRSTSHSRL